MILRMCSHKYFPVFDWRKGEKEELLQKQRECWSLSMSEAAMQTVLALVSQSGPSGGSNHASNGHGRHRVAIVPVVSQIEVLAGLDYQGHKTGESWLWNMAASSWFPQYVVTASLS